ncbi:hypothetical protein BCU70_13180 [Vibrio sp. 10N.286.49.C2]|uniref:TfoX/Sxy family DNA transformation protein n=1 Tax=unclassified Vibrio TaxID=2614977 RepID=UPI000CAAD8EE|nr:MULTISPECIES: TfoX/Sxy family DNA transformation protein [unclassified Vibrio]PMH39332.1 hypothetical protein BCU70_13180 [Vibrio sp. 10N.286.49.C2]PMH54318.1 hypothetical protein BCU66_11775 [Vibrio sp. 10N.286.49.B1]PMH79431.1 hypothetical protein BCU58_05175 [Vibrio sp. 10N.286.48.B7]
MQLEFFVDTLNKHTTLETLTIRSVFGGKGILSQGIMFALIKGDKLYVRAVNSHYKQSFDALDYKPYESNWHSLTRNYPGLTNYYEIPSDLACHTLHIATLCGDIWDAAVEQQRIKATPTRIKDLPNMQYKTERMLRKAGITSIEELRQTGPVDAYRAICQQQQKHPGATLLYSIAGALEGIHWSIIPDTVKKTLSIEAGVDSAIV